MLPQGGIFTAALLLLCITTSVITIHMYSSTVYLNTIYVGVFVLIDFRESKYIKVLKCCL